MSRLAQSLTQQQLPYTVKIAESTNEMESAFRLRYEVFVEEEGSISLANESRLEMDAFDEHCDHLIVTDRDNGRVVGTYRLLPGPRAMQAGGFYSETEFDLSAYTKSKWNSLELGRSCVAPDYRNGKVIELLWGGIADYVRDAGYRNLIGCASLRGVSSEQLGQLCGMMMHTGMLTDRYGTKPLDTHRIEELAITPTVCTPKEMYRKLPPLMKGYYWLGAEIGGEPAYDRVFDTTDFFIVLDTGSMTDKYKRRFLG